MTPAQADHIAALLNSRNQLAADYTKDKVLEHSGNYLFELQDETMVGCVEVKRVQWYQWEISHLSVREDHEGRGIGKRLIRRAEDTARDGNARIMQCTIRIGNEASEQTFRRRGYREGCSFFNSATGNYVTVWQKVLTTEDP
jgi:GNAT superfamily N-acetyltransferase